MFRLKSKDFTHQNTITKGQNGIHKINCTNAFDVFGKIAGTPQYWKNYRNELFARMEQLGPFTFFFTLSAAETKWQEVTTAILHHDQLVDKIVYKTGWEADNDKIIIYLNGWDEDNEKIVSLGNYHDRKKHKFYKDHYLLITRLFDNRVKAFINHILMSNKDVEHYSYRIGK